MARVRIGMRTHARKEFLIDVTAISCKARGAIGKREGGEFDVQESTSGWEVPSQGMLSLLFGRKENRVR